MLAARCVLLRAVYNRSRETHPAHSKHDLSMVPRVRCADQNLMPPTSVPTSLGQPMRRSLRERTRRLLHLTPIDGSTPAHPMAQPFLTAGCDAKLPVGPASLRPGYRGEAAPRKTKAHTCADSRASLAIALVPRKQEFQHKSSSLE